MKNTFYGVLMLIILSANVFAQPVERINFAAAAKIVEGVVFAVNASDDDPESIDLGILDKAREKNITLAKNATKSFVAEVEKGQSICVTIPSNISEKVSIQAEGKTLSSSDGAKYCARRREETGGMEISLTNTTNQDITFTASFVRTNRAK